MANKRQFPYSTIKAKLHKEYKEAGFTGGWRGEGLKKLTSQVYGSYKTGAFGNVRAKKIPLYKIREVAEEFIPALEVIEIPEDRQLIPYFTIYEALTAMKYDYKDKANTTLVISNIAPTFFLSNFSHDLYYTHFKAYVDRLNKVKNRASDSFMIHIYSEFDLPSGKWVIKVMDADIEASEKLEEEDEGPDTTPKKSKKSPVISDEDLDKLKKKERANALGSDKKKELEKSDSILSKKLKLISSEFNKEQTNYLKLSKAKKKDEFLLKMIRESMIELDKQKKAIQADIKANTDKLREIDKKIKS